MNSLASEIVIKKPSARRRVASVLTQEILNNPDSKDFPITSEHALCARFGVSRVTIRLALTDLEYRGLIYRRHGKGTFAHGSSRRAHRSLGIIVKSAEALTSKSLAAFVSGAHDKMTSLGSSTLLISISPLDWRADMVRLLGGVIVLQADLTVGEMDSLRNRKITPICISESGLAAGEGSCFQFGERVADALSRASLTGEPVRDIEEVRG